MHISLNHLIKKTLIADLLQQSSLILLPVDFYKKKIVSFYSLEGFFILFENFFSTEI